MKGLFSLVFCFLLVGCANFEHRSFIDQMDNGGQEFFVAGRDFEVTPGDTGAAFRSRKEVMDRTPITGLSKENMRREKSLRHELRAKEMNLSPRELAQYRKVRPMLNTTSEKIYFLGLSHYEKEEYLESMGASEAAVNVARGKYSNSRSLASLDPMGRSGREIEIGMNKDAVIQNWGRPSRVEIAGNPAKENERWTFIDNGRTRQIYFESGVVQGWALP